MTEMRRTIEILCTGRVQGVFYRANTKQIANRHGIKGWVKNQEDGSVLIRATGTQKDISALIEWCKEGPQLARVDQVTVRDSEFEDQISGFEILY